MAAKTTKKEKTVSGKKAKPAKAAAAPPPQAAPPLAWRVVRFLARFERFAGDFAGLFLLSLALLTLAVLLAPELTRGLLPLWGMLLRRWLGYGAYWMALFAAWLGLWLLRRGAVGQVLSGAESLSEAALMPDADPPVSIQTDRDRHDPTRRSTSAFWGRFLLLELAAFASLAFLAVIGGSSVERAMAGLDGGQIGWGLAELTRLALDPIGLGRPLGVGGLMFVVLLLCLAFALGVPGRERLPAEPGAAAMPPLDLPTALGVSEAPLGPPLVAAPVPAAAPRRSTVLPPQFRKNFRLEPETPPDTAAVRPRDERLPGLDLLVNERYNRPDERTINQIAGMIEKTLSEFGIPAVVEDFQVGPTVTQFAVKPGYIEKDKLTVEGDPAKIKVRVAQILALQRDLALQLSAQRLRIEAPVPGRPYVGIEVPNPRASVVRMRPILESEAFARAAAPLAVALGRDVSGQAVIADLAKMPHMLIAGTTGSGKSVCIAAITTCLVMNNTPDELRLVMIDPKMVELVRFNGLPHMYGKVETDVERIQAVLRWTVSEMERRYKVLEAYHVRNIETFNRKAERTRTVAPLPRLVVLIDELADLMMAAPEQTEHTLVRLAQMARAVGIHLVVATQRPSTEVVTGLIKANFPARISFAVASSIDSRVILDSVGAETLLGRGDMLFQAPEASSPRRVQGVLVGDNEVEQVISFWQSRRPPAPEAEPPPWEVMVAEEATLADRDGLVERAIAIVRHEQRASASMLQRRLRIGYPRAARLVDELEEMGVIGPASGGRERDVLLEPEAPPDDDF